MLVIFFAVSAYLIRLGRRIRNTPREEKVRKPIGWVVVASFILGQSFYNLPPWDIQVAFPLQLCDLAWLLGGVVLIKRTWYFETWVFYWGLMLSSQGLFTPATLAWDFPHLRFILYWVCHCFIVWSAVFVAFGLGYRPTWKKFFFCYGTTAAWAFVVFWINVALGTNYMFLNRKPPGESILDLLGPWPQYLFWESVVVFAMWGSLTAVFILFHWIRERRNLQPSKV